MDSARRFLRFTLSIKILIGYAGLSVIIVTIAHLSLSSLKRLNDINSSVIAVDAPIVEISDKMTNVILAEEFYGWSYVKNRSPELLDSYHEETELFRKYLRELGSVPHRKYVSIKKLEALHEEYIAVFRMMFGYKKGLTPSLSGKFDNALRARKKALTGYIKQMSSSAIWSQSRQRHLSAEIGARAYREIITYSIAFIALALITTALITRNIAVSIRTLKRATKKIARGEFDDLPRVKSRDELGELSLSFSEMAGRLKQLEQKCIDMSPLTRLPGNMAIEAALRKRIEACLPLAFCHFDLDNFKAFGDKYGYARGSEVIKATAQIIGSAVASYGMQDDFVGHIGGDDFVVITTPGRYERICRAAIEAFDRTAPDFYSSEDREQGFIMGKTRQGEEMAFPLMTISIGVVTNREVRDPLQVGEIAAELKEYAKSLPGSNYVADGAAGDEA